MRQRQARRCLSRLAGIIGGFVAALVPVSASAHGGLTGTADLIVDYGLLALVGILVVGGAAVSAWLAAGSPSEDDDDEAGDWEHSEAAATDGPALPPVNPTTPTAPSATSDHTAQSR